MKYGMWLDEWFRNYIQPSSKIKTCERYSEIIEKHLKVKLGEYELDELTPLVLQRYVTGLMQSGNIVTGKGLAANSVNGIITVIQNSLKLAYTLGELKEYTADKIKRPKTKEKEVSCFSLAEQKKIEQAALSSKKRKFIGIVICLYSGLRIGELLALTWSDIDFTKGTLAVNKTCHDGRDEKGNLCRITDLPKTASSKRMIPLPKQLLPVLKEYKRKSISEYVVESENGEPPTVRSYQRTFELLQKRLHIERKGFHSLRDKESQKSEDLIKRDFTAEAPLEKCITDITEIKAADGKLYVSAIFDCFDVAVVGLAMADNMRADLCVETLVNAYRTYPDLRGCIIHSDRGSQYTSEIYRNAISKYGIIQSMNSAGGRCHDNARCESMWARMKEELLYGRYNTEKLTIEELKTIIWRYFMSYWNNRRICTANGGLPPMEKRRRYELSAKRVA